MDTPMDANMRNLREYYLGSDLIYPTMYRQLIGSLMYLTNTRPDTCFVVTTLTQIMSDPWQIH